MNIYEFTYDVEKIIEENVYKNYTYDWDEDFITRSIIKDFRRRFSSVEITDWENKNIRLKWSAYKLTGKPETNYGDIAILINIHNKSGLEIEGVAFIEAKRRYDSNFDRINLKQIKKLIKNAPHSMMLLYDYQKISFASHYPLNFYWGIYQLTPYTYAVNVPSYIVDQTKNKTVALYGFSVPFSYQLCFRYLRGFDLDLDESAINVAKGITGKGNAKYLLTIDVIHGDTNYDIQKNINFSLYTENID
jgi:hypothetical protein